MAAVKNILKDERRIKNPMKTLKAKIIAVVLLCSVAAVVICGGMSIYKVSDTVDNDSCQIMTMTAQNQQIEMNRTLSMIAQSVDSFASICLGEIEDFAKFKSDINVQNQFTQTMFPIARQIAMNTEGAMTCYVRYNPNFTEPTSGIFLTKSNTSSNFESIPPTDFSQYNPSDLEHVGWYYIPVNNGKPTWMDPYLNANINIYMISYVVPLFINGESVGIVGIDIDFSVIQDKVSQIKAYDSGYAFLTSSENNILYHKDLEVGTNLQNQNELEPLVKALSDDSAQNQIHNYTYQGKEKCMVYEPLLNGMKLVITVPESEMKAATTSLIWQIVYAAVVAIILALIVGFIISNYITKPLKKITAIVADTASLNFTVNPSLEHLCKAGDEIGAIARAVRQMQGCLREMILKIQEVNVGLDKSMSSLYDTTHAVMEICDDNSATTQELAATMEETAASSENIYQNITDINVHAEEIAKLSTEGNAMSQDVHTRAMHMQKMTKDATDKTSHMYETVRHQSEEVLQQAKAVEKIEEMTKAITEISSQTNLLALNASIEAARAGEAGRGFSVVATEIGNLSNQTLSTVTNIDSIVQEVYDAVQNMSECLKTATEFLDKTVLSDYTEFDNVSKQYTNDAILFRDSMEKIQKFAEQLAQTTENVTQTVSGITTAVNEAASGISDIAGKTFDMVASVSKASDDVDENKKNMSHFEEVINQFKL